MSEVLNQYLLKALNERTVDMPVDIQPAKGPAEGVILKTNFDFFKKDLENANAKMDNTNPAAQKTIEHNKNVIILIDELSEALEGKLIATELYDAQSVGARGGTFIDLINFKDSLEAFINEAIQEANQEVHEEFSVHFIIPTESSYLNIEGEKDFSIEAAKYSAPVQEKQLLKSITIKVEDVKTVKKR